MGAAHHPRACGARSACPLPRSPGPASTKATGQADPPGRPRAAARTTSTEPQPTGRPAGGGLEIDPTAPATAPAVGSPSTGAPRDQAVGLSWAQSGDAVTTAQGLPVEDTDNSLRAGSRGPTLLEDHHLREKIMHFDHERIPERVVHARGAGAHGRFELFESLEDVTSAAVLTDTSAVTRVFVRFSTVAGSRGSADTARDVRGFAVKMYTTPGQLGSRRQQHAGVLHPGRHQVPRLHPRGEARARPGDPPGPVGARHVLGLRVAPAREHPHAHVGHVGPGHPAVVPHDGGVRRPHLPPRQRGRERRRW